VPDLAHTALPAGLSLATHSEMLVGDAKQLKALLGGIKLWPSGTLFPFPVYPAMLALTRRGGQQTLDDYAHAMAKEAVFTLKLEPELRADFMAEAEAAHRPASQVMRELMREFVLRQRQAREYDDFLRNKVESARASMREGLGQSNDEVGAEFAAVPARRGARLESHLDATSAARPGRYLGLHPE
jgi:predicted transcriptional regulator